MRRDSCWRLRRDGPAYHVIGTKLTGIPVPYPGTLVTRTGGNYFKVRHSWGVLCCSYAYLLVAAQQQGARSSVVDPTPWWWWVPYPGYLGNSCYLF